MYDLEIQTEFLSHQEFGVTDTRLSLTFALDFHAEAVGLEPTRLFRAQPFSRRCTAPMWQRFQESLTRPQMWAT